MKRIREIISFLREVLAEWNDDKAPRLAAALAYYTIFSIAPLLIVVIAVAGVAFGQEAVRGQLVDQIDNLVGEEGAVLIQDLIANSSRPNESALASIIGVVTLLLGAGGVFGQLQDALNTAWDVEPKAGGGIIATIKARFISFTMVLGVGFLLLVSLVLTTVLASLNTVFQTAIPGTGEAVLQIINQVISFGVITVLFAAIYKVLPDADIQWKDVLVGAAVTSLLFSIGKYLIGLYLGSSGVASSYGAAGSLIVILLWIFYSAQILLFGAEFTQVWARRYGSRILSESARVPVTGKPSAAAMSPAPQSVSAAPVVPPSPGAARRGMTKPVAGSTPVVIPVTSEDIQGVERADREKKLLTAGVISYLSALVGLFVVTKRRENKPARR